MTLWTVAHQAPLSMDFPGKNTGVGCYVLTQGIFPTQGSNLSLLHSQVDSSPLSHKGPNSILMAPLSRPPINLITVQRPHFPVPSPWGLGLQQSNLEGIQFRTHHLLSSAKYSSCGFNCVPPDRLEKEMATHSSILAWKIPWTEKSGGL